MLKKIEIVYMSEDEENDSVLGLLIYGSISTDEMKVISKLAKLYRCKYFDCTGIAQHYGATFALADLLALKAWKKRLGITHE